MRQDGRKIASGLLSPYFHMKKGNVKKNYFSVFLFFRFYLFLKSEIHFTCSSISDFINCSQWAPQSPLLPDNTWPLRLSLNHTPVNFISRSSYLFYRTDLLPDFRWKMSALLSTSLTFEFLGYQRYSKRTGRNRLCTHYSLKCHLEEAKRGLSSQPFFNSKVSQ